MKLKITDDMEFNDVELRASVKQFAQKMEVRLQEFDATKNNIAVNTLELLEALEKNVMQLKDPYSSPELVSKSLVDVANYCMMLSNRLECWDTVRIVL